MVIGLTCTDLPMGRSGNWPRSRHGGRLGLLAFVSLLSTSCGGGGGGGSPEPPVIIQPPPPPVVQPIPAKFVDVTGDSGIIYEHGYLVRIDNDPERFSGGVAAGDYDGDGLDDLFVVRGDIGPNLLYRNLGNNKFQDVATEAGVAYTRSATTNYRHSGPTFADMDGDGDLDLFIGNLEHDPPFLFKNNGDGTFSDATRSSGVDTVTSKYTVSAAFGDYDLDGDLDMFLTHWGTPRQPGESVNTEHLWRNDSVGGTIRFVDVSLAAGIAPDIIDPDPLNVAGGFDYTFTPTFARIDSDRYPDLLVTGDFRTSRFFTNNGDGTFSNATDPDVIIDRNGMGAAVGDYDADGDLDWFVSSILGAPDVNNELLYQVGNRLYDNHAGSFSDATEAAGVHDGGWGWGSCFADFDSDGDLDLYHTNGWDEPSVFDMDTSRLFLSDGNGSFSDMAYVAGVADTERGFGIVCADFDDDGDVDIFQLHRRMDIAATLWRNDSAGGNYLKVKLNGLAPNTEAAGARIRISIQGREQLREIMIGSNFTSQNPTEQVFGLGSHTQVDRLEVEWPDGAITSMTDVAQGQTLALDHPRL